MSGYLMRLICAAVLCALIDALAGSGAGSGMRKLTAGIFLTLVAFSVPTELDLPELDPDRFFREAAQIVAEGESVAREALAERISADCRTYIGTKAEALGLAVSVEITLDESLRPSRVELSGEATPLQRQTLCAAVAGELGMGEEDVLWTQSHQSSE